MTMTTSPLAAALAGADHTDDDLGVEVAAAYGDVEAEYRALRSGAGLVDRSARVAVRVTGADAIGYLDSLLSQSVAALADGGGAHTLLLTPQGKLDTDLRMLRIGDDLRLDAEVGRGEALVASLLRFRIRVKVDVTDETGGWGTITVRGPDAAGLVARVAEVDVPEHPHAHVGWGARRVVQADWPGSPGVDVVGPVADLADAWDALVEAGAVPAGLTAVEAVRVESGIPRQGLDIDERTIPQEAFLDRDAVSFTKGCFLGQELVCRIDTRGRVNRYLRGIEGLLDPSARLAVGAEVLTDGGDSGDSSGVNGGKAVGTVTSVAASPVRGVVALAMVRREVEPPAPVFLASPSGGDRVRATVVELPRSA